MLPALVVFDCDGVLVDSEAIANRIMAECITAAGLPITYEDCRSRFVGGTLQRVIDTVEQWLGRPLPADWKADFEARRDAGGERHERAHQAPGEGDRAEAHDADADDVPQLGEQALLARLARTKPKPNRLRPSRPNTAGSRIRLTAEPSLRVW